MKSPRAEAVDPAPDSRTNLAGPLHEVSNALTVVLGWLDHGIALLPPSRARDAIEIALDHARRGQVIARRAIGADVDDNEGTRGAASVARDAVVGVSQEAARRRIEVKLDDADGSDALVAGAPAALQVLINLLLNAIHFSPSGASVLLSVRGHAQYVEFAVSDRGPGIGSERIERLFDSPESTRPGGAGVGLRHSQALAKHHGAELSLGRTGPAGTRFDLRWPIGEAPSGTLHRTIPPPCLDGMRIVVLEDDPAVLSLIELGLGSRGASVAAVSNQAELDAAVHNGVFDAALIDLSPIGGSPDDALGRVRAKRPDLPIIIISGSAAPDIDTARVAAWVRKPFEIAELVEVLTQLHVPG